MADHDAAIAERLALVDAVDHLLSKGAVLTGEAVISLAGVDLVYLGLNVVLASVETLRRESGGGKAAGDLGPGTDLPPPATSALPRSSPLLYPETQTRGAASSPSEPAPAVTPLAGLPERLAAGADDRPERGLARLVLTLIELLRQIVERQALRRVEGDGLSDEQVERMGVALMELEAKMAELRDLFGLSEEDLNLDLGPLGRLS